MSENLRKYSYNALLRQVRKIRIPKIQRDYAQGRETPKVNEIRKVFVHKLLMVVKGKLPAAELDFVYGSDQEGAFEPLDGQQRLTTLFLLHWMMGVPLNVDGDNKHSAFTYETRNTSEEFCDELVQHDAEQFIDEALRTGKTPSTLIKGRDWFKWEWKYDPTIQSMLVMIDSIYEEIKQEWRENVSVYRQNIEHITFNLLDLGEFGLSNELFIKMNARGKELSDFDKMKSTLEEELQIQQEEKDEQGNPLATKKEEEIWRNLMDGAWIDLFWRKYARQTIINTENEPDINKKKNSRLNAAKRSEQQFKKLLLRLIAVQFLENNNVGKDLARVASNIDESTIDNLLFAYTDSLTDLRSDKDHIVGTDTATLNFKRLIDDVNLLMYKNEDGYHEISSLLQSKSHIKDDDKTLFDSFLGQKVPYDEEMIFYAMLLFLRSFPEKKEKGFEDYDTAWYFDKNEHQVWLKNLEDWVSSLRNILLNDNNTQQIDRQEYAVEAIKSLRIMSEDLKAYVEKHGIDMETDNNAIKMFLMSSNKNYTRLDNQSMEEERRKARLILDNSDWEDCIDEAERHPYLWGQIRCLLDWSGDNIENFREYSKRLRLLLDCIKSDNGRSYYPALLAVAPDCWKEGHRLFLMNKSRDDGFKRHLRDKKDGQARGANFKILIDIWINSYHDKCAGDFLIALANDKKKESAEWIKCTIEYPSILEEADYRHLFLQKGHVIMAQYKTLDSHCFDPILVYMRRICIENKIDDKNYTLYDSKADLAHAFRYVDNSHEYLVQWDGEEGNYSIKTDDNAENIEHSISPEDTVRRMKSVIESTKSY